MNLIDPTTLMLVSRALDAAALRHVAHAQNIANANVEGARTVRVSFEEQMDNVRSALQAGQPVASRDVPVAQTFELDTTKDSHIHLDDEVAALSRNAMHYQTLVRALSRHMGLMSLAVNDGRR